MNQFNAIFSAVARGIMQPWAAYPAGLLVVISVVSGVAMTWVFGKTSNQAALCRVADRSKAQILAIRLFKEDLVVTLQAQRALLAVTGRRLWYSWVPMAVLLVPFVLVLTHLAVFYERRPLIPGEARVLTMTLSQEGWERHQDLEPETMPGLAVETEALRDGVHRTLSWRLRAERAEPVTLLWQIEDDQVAKRIAVGHPGGGLQPIAVQRPGPRFFDRVLHPSETAFDADSPVQSIHVDYPARATPVLGVDVPWWATFLIVSMVTALACRRFLGVVF